MMAVKTTLTFRCQSSFHVPLVEINAQYYNTRNHKPVQNLHFIIALHLCSDILFCQTDCNFPRNSVQLKLRLERQGSCLFVRSEVEVKARWAFRRRGSGGRRRLVMVIVMVVEML